MKHLSRVAAALLATAWLLIMAIGNAASQITPTAPPPKPETLKIADNVYAFRYGPYQSMFVVTSDGVIATDPISYVRPEASEVYIAEIRKITQSPIKYVVYSHHHYDHIAGGKPFKDAGAIFIAHRNAKLHLEELKNPDVVIPDEVVDGFRAIELGGTRLELYYVGRNHSDNSLVMLLPKERILFAVDFIPIQALNFRNMADGFLPDWFESLDRVLELDWDKMISGHPYTRGQPGTKLGAKDDVRALKQYMLDLSAVVKEAAAAGKCPDAAMTEIKLPKYENWGNYKEFLPGNIERFCVYWSRGY